MYQNNNNPKLRSTEKEKGVETSMHWPFNEMVVPHSRRVHFSGNITFWLNFEDQYDSNTSMEMSI